MSIVLESLMWPQEFEEAGCPTPSSYNCMTPPIKNNSSHKQKYLRSIKTYIALSSFRILFDNLYKNNNKFFYQKRCHSAGAGQGFGSLVFKISSSTKKINSPTYILLAHNWVRTTQIVHNLKLHSIYILNDQHIKVE